MKKLLCFLLSLTVFAACFVFAPIAFADGEYAQKVALKPHMKDAKTLFIDDDFEDRETALSDSANPYKVYDSSTFVPGQDSESGEKYATNAAAWKSLVLGQKNDITSKKLAISFRYKDNEDYLRIRAAKENGTTDTLLQIQTNLIKFKPYGSDSAVLFGNVDADLTKWVHVYAEFERDDDDKTYLRKFYITGEDGTVYDIMQNFNSWSSLKNLVNGTQVDFDWHSQNVSTKFLFMDVNKANLKVDDVLIYEPDTFRISSAEYESSSNTVKAHFTGGVKTYSSIKLYDNGSEITTSAALDSTDNSGRTVIITPSITLDTENKSYTVSANGVIGYETDDIAQNSVDFGKVSVSVTDKAFLTGGEAMSKYVKPNQQITASAKVSNAEGEPALNLRSVAAYYENGALVSIGNVDVQTINGGESASISSTLILPGSISGGKIKFMSLDVNGLSPVMPVYAKDLVYKDSVNVYLVGDSVCDDSRDRSNIKRGWGGFIGDHFDKSKVNVINHGHSGYTTQNFINGDSWAKHDGIVCSWDNIASCVSEGDLVIVSLGINDNSNIIKGNFTWDDYKNALRTFADDTRANGGDILFVTATAQGGYYTDVPSEVFNSKSVETARRNMIEVANEKNAPYFDLNTKLNETLNAMTASGFSAEDIRSKGVLNSDNTLTVELPGIIYADGTHYAIDGAKLIASLIADNINETKHDLSKFAVENAPENPAGNLLNDYSFENENANVINFSDAAITSDPYIWRSGKKSYRITKTGAWGGIQFGGNTDILDIIKANGAGKYHFEAYVKRGVYYKTNNILPEINLKMVDSSGVNCARNFGANPVAIQRSTEYDSITGWDKVELDIIVNDLADLDDIEKMQLCIGVESKTGAEVGKSFWVDDASLVKYDRGTKILIMGDSTCTSIASDASQIGYGAFVNGYLDITKAAAHNVSVPAHTMKSFIDGDTYSQKWDGNLKAYLKSGDYVFVSLGINDKIAIANGKYTWEDYKDMLKKVITDSKAMGVNVLLITPTPNTKAAYDETSNSFSIIDRDAIAYMNEVADETQTEIFDLNAAVRNDMDAMLASSKTYDDVVAYYNSSDETHYNFVGAKRIAELLMNYIKSSDLPLKSAVK